MFSTMFAPGIKDPGPLTGKASSFLVMAIVGSDLIPLLLDYIAEVSKMEMRFFVPLVCFAFVVYYGLSGYKA